MGDARIDTPVFGGASLKQPAKFQQWLIFHVLKFDSRIQKCLSPEGFRVQFAFSEREDYSSPWGMLQGFNPVNGRHILGRRAASRVNPKGIAFVSHALQWRCFLEIR